MNESTHEGDLVDIHVIFLDGIALNMIDIVHKHKYGTINSYDPEADFFYVIQFK